MFWTAIRSFGFGSPGNLHGFGWNHVLPAARPCQMTDCSIRSISDREAALSGWRRGVEQAAQPIAAPAETFKNLRRISIASTIIQARTQPRHRSMGRLAEVSNGSDTRAAVRADS